MAKGRLDLRLLLPQAGFRAIHGRRRWRPTRTAATMSTGAIVLARDLAPATDFLAVEVKHDGDRHHDGGEAAEQGAGPLNAEVVEHLVSEEREAGAEKGPQQRVGRDARRRKHQVRVD